jgi:HSP20 family protein
MIITRKIVVPAAMLTATLIAGGSGCVAVAGNDDVGSLKKQISQLQSRVVELEKQLVDQKGKSEAKAPVMAKTYDPMDPFSQMEAMDRQMQAMMGAALGGRLSGNPMMHGHAASFAPDYDLKATDKAYIISFDMPGMDKAKISVEVKNGIILVSGERSSETKEDQGGKFYRQERSFGYFSRSIPLPEDGKPESLVAKYDNGVLTLIIGKKEAVKSSPVQQKIEIK